ncbi:hypothetical protein Sste5346_005796 [Sporothrix stenoceras]|uniref:Uncharacterized protein n=1 Tax=Sporothrix stenoceras TaxID=5173 RepID=A0ABR3Z1R9_9PEZI
MASLAQSSTATGEKRHRFSFLHRSHKRSSESLSTLGQFDAVPQYEKHVSNESNSDDDSASVTGSPPNYDTLYGAAHSTDAASIAPSAEGTFRPTLELQLDTRGKSQSESYGQIPRPEPIHVFMVNSRDGSALYNLQPVYTSLREKRNSNSCTLYAGAGYGMLHSDRASSSSQNRTLSTTTYRIGPGRPPRIALFDANDIRLDETNAWDYFEFSGKSIFNRVQILRSRLGTFEWRYASRDERKALSAELIAAAAAAGSTLNEKDIKKRYSVNNLMVLERVTHVFGSIDNNNGGASSSAAVGKPREVRRPVARLIRSKALRTPGSNRFAAGNGGRLQLDLSEWMSAANEAAAGDSKVAAPGSDDQADRDMVIVLAVVTCISMLKKEVDRRSDQEIAAIV